MGEGRDQQIAERGVVNPASSCQRCISFVIKVSADGSIPRPLKPKPIYCKASSYAAKTILQYVRVPICITCCLVQYVHVPFCITCSLVQYVHVPICTTCSLVHIRSCFNPKTILQYFHVPICITCSLVQYVPVSIPRRFYNTFMFQSA